MNKIELSKFIKKLSKEKIFKDTLYKIALIFISLVLFRLLIIQEFLNTFKDIVEPIKESIENIENSELMKDPLNKIKKEIKNAAERPLTKEDISELSENLNIIINDSIKPILEKIE